MSSENETIVDIIDEIEHCELSKRVKYLKECYKDGLKLDGFIFQRSSMCWIILKPTDIGKQPEYKGEPLVKVVPLSVPIDKLATVLDAQPWVYY